MWHESLTCLRPAKRSFWKGFEDDAAAGCGHTRNITKCITVIGETLRSSDTSAGENADFWQREQSRMIFNAVEVVKLATGIRGKQIQWDLELARKRLADPRGESTRFRGTLALRG